MVGTSRGSDRGSRTLSDGRWRAAGWPRQEGCVAAWQSQWLPRITLCTCWPAPLQTAKSKAQGKEAVKGRGKEPVRRRGKEPVRGRGKRGPRAQDEDELAELAEGARLLKKFKAGKVPSLNVCVCVCVRVCFMHSSSSLLILNG